MDPGHSYIDEKAKYLGSSDIRMGQYEGNGEVASAEPSMVNPVMGYWYPHGLYLTYPLLTKKNSEPLPVKRGTREWE